KAARRTSQEDPAGGQVGAPAYRCMQYDSRGLGGSWRSEIISGGQLDEDVLRAPQLHPSILVDPEDVPVAGGHESGAPGSRSREQHDVIVARDRAHGRMLANR